MIQSVYKRIHHTGIIEVLINTEEKWVDFLINRLCDEHRLEISFYEADELISDEYIEMLPNFDLFKYSIYHNQNKDQITIILIPRKLLLDKETWKEYNSINNENKNTTNQLH